MGEKFGVCFRYARKLDRNGVPSKVREVLLRLLATLGVWVGGLCEGKSAEFFGRWN